MQAGMTVRISEYFSVKECEAVQNMGLVPISQYSE